MSNKKPYWFRLFNSKKELAGYDYETLANELDLSLAGFNKKLYNKSYFKPHELELIKEKLNLTDEEFIIIALRKENE